jgi:NH3-dependent NAD+ synthetase
LDKIDENIAAKHSSADDDVDNKTDTNEEDVGSPFEMINTVYV